METMHQMWISQNFNKNEHDGVMVQTGLSPKQTACIVIGLQDYLRQEWHQPDLLMEPEDLINLMKTLKAENGYLEVVITQRQLSDNFVRDWHKLKTNTDGFRRLSIDGFWTDWLDLFEFEVNLKTDRQVYVRLVKSLMTKKTSQQIKMLKDVVEDGTSSSTE